MVKVRNRDRILHVAQFGLLDDRRGQRRQGPVFDQDVMLPEIHDDCPTIDMKAWLPGDMADTEERPGKVEHLNRHGQTPLAGTDRVWDHPPTADPAARNAT